MPTFYFYFYIYYDNDDDYYYNYCAEDYQFSISGIYYGGVAIIFTDNVLYCSSSFFSSYNYNDYFYYDNYCS